MKGKTKLDVGNLERIIREIRNEVMGQGSLENGFRASARFTVGTNARGKYVSHDDRCLENWPDSPTDGLPFLRVYHISGFTRPRYLARVIVYELREMIERE